MKCEISVVKKEARATQEAELRCSSHRTAEDAVFYIVTLVRL